MTRSNVHRLIVPTPEAKLDPAARYDAERRCAQLRMLMAVSGITSWERVTYAGELAGLLIRLDADRRRDETRALNPR